MNMEKVLTIIIPTYNMEKYLHRCLDSLIINCEDMELLEVLVINDGSKDSSSRIAHEYESKYNQTFRVIDKENGNYGSCINRGLKEASGKYIKILDADDYFDSSVLESMMRIIMHIDVDLILSDFNVVDQKGKIAKRYSFNIPRETINDFSSMTVDRIMWMHAVTYKTAILREIGYFQTEGISYTDQEWIFLPMAYISSIWCYPISLYQYVVGREGQSIDTKVLLKNFSHETVGLFKMVNEYEKVLPICKKQNLLYLDYQLKSRIRHIYMSYLCRYPSYLSQDEIMKIDNELKKYKNVYEMTDEVLFMPKIPIPFIKLWHRKFCGYRLIFCMLKYMELLIYKIR